MSKVARWGFKSKEEYNNHVALYEFQLKANDINLQRILAVHDPEMRHTLLRWDVYPFDELKEERKGIIKALKELGVDRE